jgi:hypothetical protein
MPCTLGYKTLSELLISEFDDLVKLEIRQLQGKIKPATVVIPRIADVKLLHERFLKTQARVDAAADSALETEQVGSWQG